METRAVGAAVHKMVDILKDPFDDPSPNDFRIRINRVVDLFGPAKGGKPGPSAGNICIGELVYTLLPSS